MKPNAVIDYEVGAGRTNCEIVRRLYLTEPPSALMVQQNIYFDICDTLSKFFHVAIYQIRIAGSAQTGCSFHNNRDFRPGKSDCDVAVISSEVFERHLRAVQQVALPNADVLDRPDRTVFPSKERVSYYHEFVQNVTFYGLLMPYQMPFCEEKRELSRVTSRLSEKYAELFSDINVAIYLSQDFFERKQQPNIGFYNGMVTR